jgi:hypothetical protein
MKQLQVKLTDNEHLKFKTKATSQGTNMSKLIHEWIKKYLEGKK